MQSGYVVFLAAAFTVFSAEAQQSATFTVASVKPLVQGQGGGGRGEVSGGPLNEPGRLRFPAATLKNLLMIAYDVKDFQIAGPGWLGDERFTIEATMPSDTTKDQTLAMLRNLLADRFKVQVHRETRSLPTYSMGIAKNGLKIPNTPLPHAKEPGNLALGTDGFPLVPPGLTGVSFFVINGRAKITAQQTTMHEFAVQLEKMLGAAVTDETRLTAKFDFILNFSPEGLNGPGGRQMPTLARDAAAGLDVREPLSDIFSALQSEIGIKLEQKRGPVEVIVIDHAEKVPTGN